MKKLVFAVLALVIISLAACSSITVPVMITDNPVGPKTGEATATVMYFSFNGVAMQTVLSGDFSYSAAAANGGISRIATVENRIERSLLSTKITTIVTGN